MDVIGIWQLRIFERILIVAILIATIFILLFPKCYWVNKKGIPEFESYSFILSDSKQRILIGKESYAIKALPTRKDSAGALSIHFEISGYDTVFCDLPDSIKAVIEESVSKVFPLKRVSNSCYAKA